MKIPRMTPWILRKPSPGREGQRGVASLLLVSLIMMCILMGVAVSHWIGVQRAGDRQMRAAIKESTLARSALHEARLRMMDGPIPTGCVRGVPLSFTYYLDRSTFTVTIDCDPFP